MLIEALIKKSPYLSFNSQISVDDLKLMINFPKGKVWCGKKYCSHEQIIRITSSDLSKWPFSIELKYYYSDTNAPTRNEKIKQISNELHQFLVRQATI